MNPGPDPDLLRKRVAFNIMCFRFGINPQNPPNPDNPVPVDLGTDLARSVERQILTSAALLFLQHRPFLPFTWNPTGELDLFKNLNFKKYHALCWLQLKPRMPARAEIEEAIRGAAAVQRADLQASAAETVNVDEAFELLLRAAMSDDGEQFSEAVAVPIPLEG